MKCAQCGKQEYYDKANYCCYCGAELVPSIDEIRENEVIISDKEYGEGNSYITTQMHHLYEDKPHKIRSEFKKNFWLSFLIALLVPMGIGLIASPIVWIVYLIKKKEGAHGWIAGWGAVIPLFIILVFAAFGIFVNSFFDMIRSLN